MTRAQAKEERLEFIWIVGALLIGFRFAFGAVDVALGSLHPEIARFVCGSVLGFTLGGSLGIAGLPLVHLFTGMRQRILKKGDYERTEPTDTEDAR